MQGMLQRLSSNSDKKIQEVGDDQFAAWIRAERPTEEERSFLAGLGVDEDVLHDALDPHEVPRLDIEGKWAYFITRVPDIGDDFNDFTTPMLFAFNGDQIVTVSRDSLGRLWQPFIENSRVSTKQQKQLFLMMIDAIARSYQNRVANINRQMRAVTNNITSLRPKEIRIIVEYERKLNDYLDALIPTNVALERLLGSNALKFHEDDLDEIEDLSVDLEQVIARCKSLLRTIQNVRDSYRAVMDTRLNETMRILTIATVALTIPTMLAGLMGMNVKLPFDPDTDIAFWEIIGISFFAALAVSYYFTKRH